MSSPPPSPSLLLPLLSLLLLGAALLREARSERMSGLYVDNGLDQTVVHRVVTDREKRQVEHEILNLLGLPERPPKHASHASPQVKRSAPKFLLDIYKNALDGLSGQESKAIDQSDVIMTFAARSHHVPGVRHERGKRLWFDVSEAPANERVLNGELRLFRSADAAKNRKLGQAAFTLTVYRVLRLEDGERELQYVDAVNATGNGWVTLNVTEALAHWIEHPRDNRGVYLSVHPADRHVHEMKPEDIGIVGFKGQVDKQPFMVGFFKSSGAKRRPAAQVRALPSTRSKREAKSTKRRKTADFLGNLDWRFGNPYTDPQLQHNAKTCRIQTLYVSFKDLSWQDWIIAPEGFDAYYCSGECNFPLNAHMNATNHAIVQTLVHLVNPGKVPKPCCAPTKLTPISVLYFYDETNVILKKYKNMVVKSCGCH